MIYFLIFINGAQGEIFLNFVKKNIEIGNIIKYGAQQVVSVGGRINLSRKKIKMTVIDKRQIHGAQRTIFLRNSLF